MSELEKESGENRRTIHFYKNRKLLPEPIGTGGGARYTKEHLVKLLVIRKLQKSQIKLIGIKKRMSSMSFDEMEEFVQEELNRLNKSKILPSVDELDEFLPNAQDDFKRTPRDIRIENFSDDSPNYLSFSNLMEDTDTRPRHSKTRGQGHILSKVTRTTSLQRETWQRISITEGVELNIRQDVLHGRRREIDQVLREIREKLDR